MSDPAQIDALASILRRVERPRAYAGDWEADTARRQLRALADAGFDVVRREQPGEVLLLRAEVAELRNTIERGTLPT